MYFDKAERQNTDQLIPFAVKRMEELAIKNVVLVWSSGYTARKFMEIVPGRDHLNVVVVTNPSPHSISRGIMPVVITARDTPEQRKMKEEQLKQGIKEFSVTISDEVKRELESKGVKVCYLNDDLMLGEPLALGTENTGRRARLLPFGLGLHIRPLDIDAGGDLSPFTTISQGFRVCVGCTILAVKYGFIPEGETVMAFGGRSTALVLRAGAKPKTTIVKEIVGFERGSSHFERDPNHPDGD